MFNGEMIIFGGKDEWATQYSRVSGGNGCGMESVGQLPFEFNYGTCHEYIQPVSSSNVIYLCFPESHKFSCWTYDGTRFLLSAPSAYTHYESSIGVYNGDVVAIAGNVGLNVEVFGLDNLKWRTKDPVPAVNAERLIWFSTVTYEQILYVFG